MEDIIKKAQGQFRDIQVLLSFPSEINTSYFTKLSIATEEAYFTMNTGLCSTIKACKNCLSHRDFIRSLMDVLGELEVNSTSAEKYHLMLSEYLVRVNTILERISAALSSQDTSRLKYGLPL